jgi:hypothetical protein
MSNRVLLVLICAVVAMVGLIVFYVTMGSLEATVATAVVAIIGMVTNCIQALSTAWVQSRQIRPTPMTSHRCRICRLDVYTYFDEDNRIRGPLCAYLAKDGTGNCQFDHTVQTAPAQAAPLLRLNEGKC